MPIDWALIGLIALLTVGTVVAVYTLSMLNEWVRTRIGLYRNRQILVGAVRQRLENNNYKVVPFIFDKQKQDFVDAEAIETESLDEDLDNEFGEEDAIVICETQGQ